MADRKIMRNITLNEKVAIELPAHIWLAFMAQYATTKWSSDAASHIVVNIQEALLDPIYIKERQAEAQSYHDRSDLAFQMFMGQHPDIPPNMEGPEMGGPQE
jgi:hypothetical protein